MKTPQLSLDGAVLIDPNVTNDIQVEIPQAIVRILEANRHLITFFNEGVAYAVQYSFGHPHTKLRGDIRMSEVKFRYNMVYEAVRQMYYDQRMSLQHCVEIAPKVLVDALKMGARPEELGAQQNPHRWGVDLPKAMVVDEDAGDIKDLDIGDVEGDNDLVKPVTMDTED